MRQSGGKNGPGSEWADPRFPWRTVIPIAFIVLVVRAAADGPLTLAEPVREGGNFVSFTRKDHEGNRIGYRLHEHRPFVFGEIPPGGQLPSNESIEREFSKRPRALIHTRPVREDGWVPQDWTYYFAPAPDGVDLLWVVRTFDEGLNEFYCVQQCFRMSGRTNEAWRREIAEAPAFSEYDLWSTQEQRGEPWTSLTYVPTDGDWRPMPATRDHVAYRTSLGIAFDRRRQNGNMEEIHLPPYGPTINAGVIDSGLVTRTDPAGEWVCALYWERTTHITNHHPADCVHAVVNLGPIPPHGRRLVRGKIYWARMTKQKLLEAWKRDFGN